MIRPDLVIIQLPENYVNKRKTYEKVAHERLLVAVELKSRSNGITLHDRIIRHSIWIYVMILLLLAAPFVYLWSQGSITFEFPEFAAISISIIALTISLADFIGSQMLQERKDDIKALHGLRSIRDIHNALLYEIRMNATVAHPEQVAAAIEQGVVGIDEAIPGASYRFRKSLYKISVEYRAMPINYIINYMYRRVSREQRIEEMQIKGEKHEEPPLGMDSRISKAVDLHEDVMHLINRMEYVYSGGPVTPEEIIFC